MTLGLVHEMRARLHRGPGGLSKSGLATAMGRKPQVVTMILQGKRQIKAEEIPLITRYLGLSDYGMVAAPIPVIGQVGPRNEVHLFDDLSTIEQLEAPPGLKQAKGLRVHGDSMTPAFNAGDVLIFDEPRYSGAELSLIGEQCVVKITDGPMLVKMLAARGAGGLWTLFSFTSAPLIDVQIEWAAPIVWVRRGRPTRGAADAPQC